MRAYVCNYSVPFLRLSCRYEYDVEWAGSNLDRTWEPAPNIHSQLVNDFDRLQAQQDAAFAADHAMVSMVTSPYSTARGASAALKPPALW